MSDTPNDTTERPPFEETKAYKDELEQFVFNLFSKCSVAKNTVERVRVAQDPATHHDVERWIINELTQHIDGYKSRQQRKREAYDRGEL